MRLGCSSAALHSATAAAPFPPVASTSAHTLDHPPPPSQPQTEHAALRWSELVPHKLSSKSRRAKEIRASWLKPKSTAPAAARTGWPTAGNLRAKNEAQAGLPPPNDRGNVSPFLPLVTRERNFFLANLRHALHSRRPPRTARRANRRAAGLGPEAAPWHPEQVWNALARVLRYPQDTPTLPHSQFPSSTRAPAVLAADGPADPGFFTSSRNADEAFGGEESADALGRSAIELSLPELRRAFTVFAAASPRTRNGLNRLLVVAELIAKKRGGDRVAPASFEPEQGDDHRLRGGGAGLRDKDWTTLVLAVGANLRTTRADPEIKSTLALFSQRLGERAARGAASETYARGSRRARMQRRNEQHLYNALLFVVGRAKMWELFEQVLQRMREARLEPDAATLVELIKRDEQRGAPVSSAWSLFERGLATEGIDAEGRRALWAAIVLALARRGLLDEAMQLYAAMRTGELVDVTSLRPVEEHVEALTPLVVAPPPPDDRVCTSLVQAFAYRGDLAGAVRILHDILASGPDDLAQPLRPAVHHFTPIFRAFARHGQAPRGRVAHDVDHATLGGAHVRSHALRRDAFAFSALVAPGPSSGRAAARARTPAAADGRAANPFTLSALRTLFDSFLSLAPPPRSAHADEPFLGSRTASSAKDLFWVLFAFDRLSGGDSRTVLAAWQACEAKFAGGNGAGGRANGWTGWKMDGRVLRLVNSHRAVLQEQKRRLEELE